MMKRLLFSLAFAVLLPALALAQSPPRVTPDDGVGNVLGTAAGTALAISPVPGATQVVGAGTGTTAATTATLAGAAGKTTFICGFTITAGATAAANGAATVATLIGAVTFTYNQAVGTATAPVKTTETFSPCVPANATNTAITVTSAAAGTAGVTDVNAWGFQK